MVVRNRRRRLITPPARKPNLEMRRRVLMSGLGLAFLSLTGAVFYRQVIETDFLRAEGERRYLRVAEIPARRGMILDRNGEPLAVSTPVETVWCEPRKLVQQPQAIPALARALGLNEAELRKRITANAERGFLYLKRRVTFDEARAVRELLRTRNITGVDFDSEYRRYYPSGEVFAHVVGFTDIEDRGSEGLELEYDKQLRAMPGLRRVIRDGRKHIVQEVEQLRPPHQGQDLTLSLDRRLQFLAYRELAAAVKEHQAVGGTLVAIDVETGEILAMVNQPGYNPNVLQKGNADHRRNRAVTDVLEPGSTVKPFVVSAALEKGLITPTTPIDTEPGFYRVGRHLVRDVHDYGPLDVTGVITKSSNVGAVKIAQMMEYSDLWNIYDRIGFGKSTDIDFPGETQGLLRPYKEWREFEHATMAFGYGLSVTTLQLAHAYTILAADGIKRPLTLFKRDHSSQETAVSGTRVLSAATAQAVRTMMETVVSDQGTARRAQIPGYRVAGKTGTAKKAGEHGYAGHRYQAVFAGLAPVSRPRLVIAVMVDEPQGTYYGGTVAAPVFQKVMSGALRLFNVPPDNPSPSMLLASHGENPE